VSQKEINQWLVDHALQNKLVVRLKGGDVTVFANLLEELESISEFHIPYEIVPGITAASGASAYAGLPLTARGYSTGVRFLTYYRSDIFDEAAWKELAFTDDTLVFYMSSNNFGDMIHKLSEHTIGDDKSIVAIEQATTQHQRVRAFSFKEALNATDLTFTSPTIVIIGRVAKLHKQFAWIAKGSDRSYFRTAAEMKKLNSMTSSLKLVYAG
jgi:uroporphyrin-III C-methyltransferase / precorrin-2 dehydrogenase / sirohydrochlorin ferrochelatase